MVKPKFDIEATEKAISKLIERIKKAFYKHQPTFSDDSLRHSKATERKKPHDSSRCEACHKGKCHLGRLGPEFDPRPRSDFSMKLTVSLSQFCNSYLHPGCNSVQDSQTKGLTLYLVFPVIVIVTVILAMFTFYFCPKLQDKHCRDHYDYHRENKIQYPSLRQ